MARKKKKGNAEIGESWLLPYSDLLTLLLALFIVLYAVSEVNEQQFQELANVFRQELSSGGGTGIIDGGGGYEDMPPLGTNDDEGIEEGAEDDDEEDDELEELTGEERASAIELQELRGIQTLIEQYILERDLTDSIGTELTDEGLMLRILDDVLFDSASSEVKEDGVETARELSDLLSSDPPHQIVISGHADDIPIANDEYGSNWELSVARALSFMIIVLENGDLNPTLFSAKGFGEFQPVAPNDTADNRAKNRRVEVLILPNYEIKVD